MEDPNYNPIHYVNQYLQEKPDDVPMEEYLSSCIPRFMDLSLHLTDILHEQMTVAHRSLPSLVTLAQQVDEQWTCIRGDICKQITLEGKGMKQEETKESMQISEKLQTLAQLQKTQTKMEKAIRTLRNTVAMNDSMEAIKQLLDKKNWKQLSRVYAQTKNTIQQDTKTTTPMQMYESQMTQLELTIETILKEEIDQCRKNNECFTLPSSYFLDLFNLTIIMSEDFNIDFFKHYASFRLVKIYEEWRQNTLDNKFSADKFVSFYFTDVLKHVDKEFKYFAPDLEDVDLKSRLFIAIIEEACDLISKDIFKFLVESFDIHMKGMFIIYERYVTFAKDIVKSCKKHISLSYRATLGQPLWFSIWRPFVLLSQQYDNLNSSLLWKLISEKIPNFKEVVDVKNLALEEISEGNDKAESIQNFVQHLEETLTKQNDVYDSLISNCIRLSHGILLPSALDAITMSLRQLFFSMRDTTLDVRKYFQIFPCSDIQDLKKISKHNNWEHFHCVLEMLKLIGNVQIRLKKYENDLMLRLKIYMDKHWNEDMQLQKSAEAKNDEEEYIKEAMISTLLSDPILNKNFKNLLGCLCHLDPEKSYFMDPSYYIWRDALQSMVYDIVSLPIKRMIYDCKESNKWTEVQLPDALGFFNVHLLPQESMTLAADSLLNLVSQLQPFSSSHDFRSCFLACNGMEELALNDWKGVLELLKFSSEEKEALLSHLYMVHCRILLDENDDTNNDEKSSHKFEDEDSNATALVDLFTKSVTSGVLAFLVSVIINAGPTVSEHGAKQLKADLSYLRNVLTALGVSPPLLFMKLFDLLENKPACNKNQLSKLEEMMESRMVTMFSTKLLP